MYIWRYSMNNSNTFKVRLDSYSLGTSNTPTSSVTFDVMPTLSESITVDYVTVDPIHAPGSFYIYKGTKSSTYDLGDIKLVSRTPEEASKNQAIRNTLKGWTKPFFGTGTAGSGFYSQTQEREEYQIVNNGSNGGPTNSNSGTSALTQADIAALLSDPATVKASNANLGNLTPAQQAQQVLSYYDYNNSFRMNRTSNRTTNGGRQGDVGKYKKVTVNQQYNNGASFLGAPPEVLYLTAYSDATASGGKLDKTSNISKVPVVITSMNYSYPNDVDYIQTLEGEPWPIIMTISLSLAESHSPQEFDTFDLFAYRDGKLPGF